MNPSESLPLGGRCDPRFEAVRSAFHDNFTQRGEVGAAVAIHVDGTPVVDLWGGWADASRIRPWRENTLVNVFSVGKAVTALCIHRLIERGQLALDVPMARLWPELGRDGKEEICLRQVLSHTAGLPAIDAPLAEDAMLDWETMIAALERQLPWWAPGEQHGYHVNTFGYLLGEMIRRAARVTVGEMIRTEIAAPLMADFHIGLSTADQGRAADFVWPELGIPTDREGIGAENLMRWCAYFNPAGISGAGWVNHPRWRAAEIPSTNAHATANGVARFYAALAAGGTIDGHRLIEQSTLAEAVSEQVCGIDQITQKPARFGLGFQLTQPERRLGPNGGAFGHFGAGGSLGFCDPQAGVAFAYVMNELGPRWQNPRNAALIEALYASL